MNDIIKSDTSCPHDSYDTYMLTGHKPKHTNRQCFKTEAKR